MKNQFIVLLLVVLFVSLPSVVFAQPPLSAVQSGETSSAVPTPVTVGKSWEGPLIGLGVGLGFGSVTVSTFGGESASSPVVAILPVKIRLGYGLSDRTVLYGSVIGLRSLAEGGDWGEPGGLFGMMFRGRIPESYGFASLGASFSGDPQRAFVMRGGYGFEMSPGLSVEGAGMILYASDVDASATGYSVDLTFNYHFY